MADWIPVVSQVKSFVQAVTGNTEGARQTQENFSRQCPIVSQARSAVEAITGDTDAAEQTQLEFLKNASRVVDSVPVVGHVKGGVHYVCGDTKGGDMAMKRATGVAGGAALGLIAAGPIGAVAGGITASEFVEKK